ncbi:MAG: hypothetical protein LBH35_10530 [Treponema sp.]|jgi:hypothetical protein|nr:hypothetical protein [Treponema sp.]
MEDLFGSLIYLIPIALVIVRVIAAAGNSKKKSASGPPPRPPARAPAAAPARKRAAKAKPVPPKKEPPKPSWDAPLAAGIQDTSEQTERAPQTVQAEPRNPLPRRLSPLQQGFLWAEILGPAKAMQD